MKWNLNRIWSAGMTLHGMIPQALMPEGRAINPLHMYLELTFRCNYRCSFCWHQPIHDGRYVPAGPVRDRLPAAHVRRLVEELPAGRLITLTGGEPMLHPQFPQILDHACREHRVHVITNGSRLTPAMARACVRLAPRRIWQRGLVAIGVSIQGSEAQHDAIVNRPGSWRRSMAGLRRLLDRRREAGKSFPKIILKMTVTEQTYRSMAEFMGMACELGVDMVSFLSYWLMVDQAWDGAHFDLIHQQPPVPPGVDIAVARQQLIRCFELSREHGVPIRLSPHAPIDHFLRHYSPDRSFEPEDYVCEGAWSSIAVGGDGLFAPTCPYIQRGSMLRDSLDGIWNDVDFCRFRRELTAGKLFPGCQGCCSLRYTGPAKFGLAGI